MDWNADNLKDLLVGEYNGNVRYYRNIGTATNPVLTYVGLIQVAGTPLDVGDYSTPWTDDWNGDNLIDLLVGASDGYVRLYINVGTNANPTFNATQYVMMATGGQLNVGYRSAPSVIDYNGDNVKDLVSGEINGKVYFYENNGTNQIPLLAAGVYLMTGSQQLATSGTARPTPIDWDNDGDQDLVVGSYDAYLRRFMQVTTTTPAPTCDINNTGTWIFPASGGRLQYSIAASNPNATVVIFDAWTKLKNPNGSWTGPLINRSNVSLAPGGSITRNLWLDIPAFWPSGYYYMYLYLGDYLSTQIFDEDYLYFAKSATDEGSGPGVTEFAYSDWDDDPSVQVAAPLPERISLSASPNPFNPTTTLDFALPQAEKVLLEVYTAAGQRVSTLANGYRQAGSHQLIWDATTLPAGIYFVELRAGSYRAVQKLLLIK